MKFKAYTNTKGFSLIEIMVALSIASILSIAFVNVFAISKRTYLVQNDSSNMQESSRSAVNMLNTDIRRVGYFGYNPGLDTVVGSSEKITNTNTCPNDGTWALMLDRRIVGKNDSVTNYACIGTDYLRGDIVALRYAESSNDTVFENSRYYLRSSFKTGKVFLGSTQSDAENIINDGTPEVTGKLRAYAYYVGDSTRTCKFNSSKIPVLYRESLDANGLPVKEEVASGIENFQVQYGVDSNGDNAVNQYFDADNISNDISATPNWNQVVAVHYWLLARADCPSASNYTNKNTYVMGDQTIVKNDNFKRKLYSSTVKLRNF